ncbi:hypothetical protein [Kribbella shirazensis]|uniref:Uncharacterized protein n=1 Tax=Kribbella shirazensis TaxID=1105143 RepID=A0A7X5VB30_9ACTN|nr:hypothetical protein [Kribbella shirazensis]NIK57867.1 hypothetical protein [Kribbella shirazensis]
MGPDESEPLEPDQVFTAEELLQKKDPRIGVADATGAVKRRPRLWRGGRWIRRDQGTERQNEGLRR